MSARQTVRADRSLPELQSVSSGDLAQPLWCRTRHNAAAAHWL